MQQHTKGTEVGCVRHTCAVAPSHLLICPTVSEHLPHAQLWEWQQDFCSDSGRPGTMRTKFQWEKEGAERELEMEGFALILARWL